MVTFQLQLPRIHAVHLNSEERMLSHLKELKQKRDWDGHYEWDEARKAIVKITYHSAYGDSVDERRNTLVFMGSWVVWSTANEKEFHYVKVDGDEFTEEYIPKTLLSQPLIPVRVKPFVAREPSKEELLW